jgi:DHA2 family multidrug resistance protein
MKSKTYSKYAIAWTVAIGLFMVVLDTTVVNVALVPMAAFFKTDLGGIQWVITAYFLTVAAVIPLAGYFGNRFGLKRLFTFCLALFTLGSLLCGLAPGLEWLIFFRVVQGLGGGGLFPLALALALKAFPPQERASASAVIGVSALVAPAVGPSLGGILTDVFGWQAIFFINLPVGLLCIFLVREIIPADEPAQAISKGFDVVGLALSISGVLSIVYALALVSQTIPGTITALQPRGEIYGWGYWQVWALLAAGALILAIFAYYELVISRNPVLDLRLIKQYSFSISTVVCCAVAMAIFGSFFLLPVFFEQVRMPHFSPTEAGLLLLPQGIASALATLLSGRLLYNRIGVRNLVLLGAVFLIAGTWGITGLQTDVDGWSLIPWTILRGLGFGFAYVPVQTRALQEVTGPALSKASSLLSVVRQIFSTLGTSITSTTFLQQTTLHLNELSPNSPTGSKPTLSELQQAVATAGTSAVNDVFFLVLMGSILIFLLALALPRQKPDRQKPSTSNLQSAEALVEPEGSESQAVRH